LNVFREGEAMMTYVFVNGVLDTYYVSFFHIRYVSGKYINIKIM